MTEVVMEDGSKVETNLPADKVADLQAKPVSSPESAKAAEPEKQPAKPEAEGKTAQEPAKPEPAPETKTPESAKPESPVKQKKASPIEKLLNQRHDLETSLDATKQELESERKSKAELEAKIVELSKQPQTPAAQNKLAEIAAKYKVEPEFLKELVDIVREGITPNAASPEVKQLLAEREQEKAVAEETKAFNNRVDKLGSVFKDEPIKDHREKLMELAYSTEKAPDGERYCDKELSELYFGYIKPTVEPGTASAEASRRAPVKSEVVDFEDILNRDDPSEIEKMDDATFKKYSAWLNEKQGQKPISHR